MWLCLGWYIQRNGTEERDTSIFRVRRQRELRVWRTDLLVVEPHCTLYNVRSFDFQRMRPMALLGYYTLNVKAASSSETLVTTKQRGVTSEKPAVLRQVNFEGRRNFQPIGIINKIKISSDFIVSYSCSTLLIFLFLTSSLLAKECGMCRQTTGAGRPSVLWYLKSWRFGVLRWRREAWTIQVFRRNLFLSSSG